MGNGYRQYDPIIGQFDKADSYDSFSTLNTYNQFNYADNNPMGNSDPSGHFPLNTSNILAFSGMAVSIGAPFLMLASPAIGTALLLGGAGLNVASSASVLKHANSTQWAGYGIATLGEGITTLGMFSLNPLVQLATNLADNALEGAAMPMMQGNGKFSLASSAKSVVAALPYAITLAGLGVIINKGLDAIGNENFHQLMAGSGSGSDWRTTLQSVTKAFTLGGARASIGEIVRYYTYNPIAKTLGEQTQPRGNLAMNAALSFGTGGVTMLGAYLTNMYIKLPLDSQITSYSIPVSAIELSTGLFNYGWPQQFSLPDLESSIEQHMK